MLSFGHSLPGGYFQVLEIIYVNGLYLKLALMSFLLWGNINPVSLTSAEASMKHLETMCLAIEFAPQQNVALTKLLDLKVDQPKVKKQCCSA